MKGFDLCSYRYLPSLYHFDQRLELHFQLLVRFSEKSKVTFWIALDPPLLIRVRDTVGAALRTVCWNNVKPWEAFELDTDRLPVALAMRSRIRLPHLCYDECQ